LARYTHFCDEYPRESPALLNARGKVKSWELKKVCMAIIIMIMIIIIIITPCL
jgi:hypothetical protein